MTDFEDQPSDNQGVIRYPFNGNPPEDLLEEADDYLNEIADKFESLLEKCRAEGITVVLLLNSYDPLTGTAHNSSRTVGNFYTQKGVAHAWIERNAQAPKED